MDIHQKGHAAPLPIGITITFHPTDEEILGFFLKNLYTNGPEAIPVGTREFLRGIDMYGEAPPWEISMQFPESRRDNFYVYTKLKKKSEKRIARTVGNGKLWTWKGQSKRIRIEGVWRGDVIVGEKKTLSLMENGKTTHWTMMEYTLLKINGRRLVHENESYVICHITYSYRRDDDDKTSDSSSDEMASKRPRMSTPPPLSYLTSPSLLPPSQSYQGGAIMEPGSSSDAGCRGVQDHHQQQFSYPPSQFGAYMEPGSSSAAGGGHQYFDQQQFLYAPSQFGTCMREPGSSSTAGGPGGQDFQQQQLSYVAPQYTACMEKPGSSTAGGYQYPPQQQQFTYFAPPLHHVITEQRASSVAGGHGDTNHQEHQLSSVASQSHHTPASSEQHHHCPTPNLDDNEVYISLDMLEDESCDANQQQFQLEAGSSSAAAAAATEKQGQQLEYRNQEGRIEGEDDPSAAFWRCIDDVLGMNI